MARIFSLSPRAHEVIDFISDPELESKLAVIDATDGVFSQLDEENKENLKDWDNLVTGRNNLKLEKEDLKIIKDG